MGDEEDLDEEDMGLVGDEDESYEDDENDEEYEESDEIQKKNK